MSAWRRKALALFPARGRDLNRRDYRPFDLFLDLLTEAKAAHLAPDDDAMAAPVLRRLHGFAEWCLHQPGELWNQAAIGFYENLLNGSGVPWEKIIPWLSPYVAQQIEAIWALGTAGEHASRFRKLLRDRQRTDFQTHVYATGEIAQL